MQMRGLILFSSILLLAACGGGTGVKQADTAAVKQPEQKASDHHPDDRKVLNADEQSLTDEYTGPAYHLFGKEVTCNYTEIPARLSELLPALMKEASDQKAVITGSYMIALKAAPVPGKAIPVFIGLPLKKPLKTAGFTTLEIPARKYIRLQLKAEPGTALDRHLMVNQPMGQKKMSTGFPILESYAETRNSEMTSVISKATFLYPLP